jgi:uncharacterized protein YbjT (DUF2867 family)
MILVTSAGGKTGRAMVKAFAEAGEGVRALVRRSDAKDDLLSLGAAEVATGDLRDGDAITAAAEGCSAIYYIAPNMNEDEQLFGDNIVAAAKAAGVGRLAFHSVLHTQVQALRHHWKRLFVEEAIVESGVPFTILQVGSYFQNMLPGWKKMAETGIHAMAYETEAPMSLVDLDDVAEAALRVVRDPGCANGIFEICGPVITLREKADILTRVLGRRIEARKLPPEEAISHAAHMGVGAYGQGCMRAMFAHYDVHGLVGSARPLEWILGRPPADFEAFARRTAAAMG